MVSSSKEGIRSPQGEMAIKICKISPLTTPKQIPIKVEVLVDYVLDNFEHFSQTKECNEIHWLLLTALEKMGKEKCELRASKSQLKLCFNDLEISISDLQTKQNKTPYFFCCKT